ncbi:hypothetical protein WJX74_003858 [Apatococcus lobatus]|uniref:Kinesin motor domain-containing protein n=1 Tax=Apatococcus lobatus TaxID=904363 RepID=A0AAW1RWG9_9CHLO
MLVELAVEGGPGGGFRGQGRRGRGRFDTDEGLRILLGYGSGDDSDGGGPDEPAAMPSAAQDAVPADVSAAADGTQPGAVLAAAMHLAGHSFEEDGRAANAQSYSSDAAVRMRPKAAIPEPRLESAATKASPVFNNTAAVHSGLRSPASKAGKLVASGAALPELAVPLHLDLSQQQVAGRKPDAVRSPSASGHLASKTLQVPQCRSQLGYSRPVLTCIADATAAPRLQQAVAGKDCTVIMAGQTGSGKTHTTASFVQHTLHNIFPVLPADEENRNISWTLSMVELHGSSFKDLLQPGNCSISMRQQRLQGQSLHTIASAAQATRLVNKGLKVRQTGSHALNATSSRSHMFVTFRQTTTTMDDDQDGNAGFHSTAASFTLLDLAGSERMNKTGAINGSSLAQEGNDINTSLSALEKMCRQLANPRTKHVSYRDHPLTQALQSSVDGGQGLAIIGHVRPEMDDVKETESTLRFAEAAGKMRPKVSTPADVRKRSYAQLEQTIARIQQDNSNVQQENASLRLQLDQANLEAASRDPTASAGTLPGSPRSSSLPSRGGRSPCASAGCTLDAPSSPEPSSVPSKEGKSPSPPAGLAFSAGTPPSLNTCSPPPSSLSSPEQTSPATPSCLQLPLESPAKPTVHTATQRPELDWQQIKQTIPEMLGGYETTWLSGGPAFEDELMVCQQMAHELAGQQCKAQAQMAGLKIERDHCLQQARTLSRKCRLQRTALRLQRAQAVVRVSKVRVKRQEWAATRHHAEHTSRLEWSAAEAAVLREARVAAQVQQAQQLHQYQHCCSRQQQQQRSASWFGAASAALRGLITSVLGF